MENLTGAVLFKRGRWQARVRYQDSTGQTKELSKSCTNKTEARRVKDDWLRELETSGARAVEKSRATFAEYAEWFKAEYLVPPTYTAEGVKAHGLRSLRSAEMLFKVVKDHFGPRPLREIRYSDLRAFRLVRVQTETRRGKRRSIATINRELAMARRLFRVAHKDGWIPRDPFTEGDSLIALSHERERERILTRDEEHRLLSACEARRFQHLRPLVIAALDTGCRRGELLKLEWRDVDFQRNTILVHIFNSKTMRERLVGITHRLRAELLRLRQEAGDSAIPNARVFSAFTNEEQFSAKRAWDSVRRIAGLTDVRFHDLRHTAASRLAQQMSLSDVGKILGHREPRTTWRYANTDESTLARAVTILNAL